MLNARPVPVPRSAGGYAGLAAVIVLSVLSTAARAQETDKKPGQDLTELTPEQLADLEVTSVSKKPEKRWRSPAAVYVVTRDEIRRSGATTLVEALRLAPGVQVARIDSNKWAVGIRGFASRLSRSLLVLVDGRSVYTPLFAGTYWEVQDTLLEDVERIEIIRGPGGSLWGTNSVNGVINIITRSSRETQGTFVTVGGGTNDRGFVGLRHGGTAREGLTYRLYAKGFDRAPAFHASGHDFDAWHMAQGGFRADWERGTSDSASLQGDIYGGKSGQRTSITTLTPPFLEVIEEKADLSGANLLARWRHVSSAGADWAIRAYYDRTDRSEPSFGEVRNTVDLDLQRRALYGRHDVIFGLGYRVSSGTVKSVPTIEFAPAQRTDHLFSGFARDELSLFENRLIFALGSKFERNDYSGFEFQPTAQALWLPTPRQSFWAAVSQAVRTPSRVEHDLTLTALLDPRTPAFIRIVGDEEFRAEKVLSVQIGYRVQPARRVAIDAVAFHNRHTKLLSLESAPPSRETSPPPGRLIVPLLLRNGVEGKSYGLEATADWTPVDWWRIGGSYSYLRLALKPASGSLDTTTASNTSGSAPRHTTRLQSRLELGEAATLDIIGRYVGRLSAQRIPGYTSVDARLAWHPASTVEIAIVGENLLAPRHAEFPGGGGEITEIQRGVYGAVTWRR